ncbi:hypothetical protein P3T27_001578 [Kitasatospora sp. MAA19]|uniref:hypothetical protein n=1 Tax=unclassified Kitasatospora TaxID=2633591 RepID=UPI002473720D|nr:hypothetical protein [Kitasatospora sp. MAA19]MDH6704875.1 hypothetical protein [Kitasatospora sp. MAA19]
MSTNRSRRIDRDAAEHLLGGAVGGPPAGQDASLTGPDDGPGQLARVLAAAAAPATARELAGEEAALAAFREARLTSDPLVTAPVRRRSMATAALARAFSTKATAAVLGATALCGVAVAAGTGNLPSPLGGGSSTPEHTLAAAGGSSGSAPGTPSADSSAGSSSASPGTSSGAPSARPSGGSSGGGPQVVGPSTAPTTPGSPSADADADGHGTRSVPPALIALCRAFADRTGKGERLLGTEPQFGPLVSAAGGAEKMADFCAEALGAAGDDHQDATAPSPGPGRTVPGATKGNGGDGKGNGKDNADGGNGKGNGQDRADGGAGAKPGRSGATIPALPAVPTPPDVRPSRPDRSGSSQSDQPDQR